MDVRVLIVSADADERQRAASALRLRQEVDVTEAASGAEAADLLRGHGFDVLVIDGDLRPKGGFSWLYELREQASLDGTQRSPAVVMTARRDDDFLARWSGAEAIVRKPVEGFEVADHVARLGVPA